jgi:hypothetical protein
LDAIIDIREMVRREDLICTVPLKQYTVRRYDKPINCHSLHQSSHGPSHGDNAPSHSANHPHFFVTGVVVTGGVVNVEAFDSVIQGRTIDQPRKLNSDILRFIKCSYISEDVDGMLSIGVTSPGIELVFDSSTVGAITMTPLSRLSLMFLRDLFLQTDYTRYDTN